jgi:hypothetical protein
VCGSDVCNGKQREIPQGMREFLSDFFKGKNQTKQTTLPGIGRSVVGNYVANLYKIRILLVPLSGY